jgi:hypothetical protein
MADWEVERIVLDVGDCPDTPEELMGQLVALRNVVQRQHVHLTAVKPARARDPQLLKPPPVQFRKVATGG